MFSLLADTGLCYALFCYSLTQGLSQWRKSAGPKFICRFSQNTSPNNHNLLTLAFKATFNGGTVFTFVFRPNHSLCLKRYNIGRDERRTHCWIPERKTPRDKESKAGLRRTGLSLPTVGATFDPPVCVCLY